MEETSNSIMIVDKENIIQKLTKIFWIFLIGSILGYGIEMIVGLVQNGHFVKRGFLFGPICPIYGFGAVILLFITKKMYQKPFQKFLIATITFTVFEYIVSLVLEMVFGLRWWDYTNDILNIQGRVSLLYSVCWGIIGVIVLEKIHPFIQNKIQNITKGSTNNIIYIICLSLIFILLIDVTFSTSIYLK